jgi:hypothetical protein
MKLREIVAVVPAITGQETLRVVLGAASSVVNPLDFTVTNATPTVGALFVALGANRATLIRRLHHRRLAWRARRFHWVDRGYGALCS